MLSLGVMKSLVDRASSAQMTVGESYNSEFESITHAHLCSLVFDLLFARQVALVANKKLVHPLGCVPIDFMQPLFDIVKRVSLGRIVPASSYIT